MKLRYKVLLFLAPFILMVLVNELVRPTIKDKPYGGFGVTFINGEVWTKDKCSWACHNSSAYCEKHHIAYVRPIKQYIDPVYFGIIHFLKDFKIAGISNYAGANILFLVVGWPLLMWYLLVQCISMTKKLKQ